MNDLMTRGEVAKQLHLSTSGVLWLERCGELSSQRDARGTRWYRRQEVESVSRRRRGIKHPPRRLRPDGLGDTGTTEA